MKYKHFYYILLLFLPPTVFLFLFTQVVCANFAFNFLLFNLLAAQAAAMPDDEPSEIQTRFTTFKAMVIQLKDIMDRAIANSPDSQQLYTP